MKLQSVHIMLSWKDEHNWIEKTKREQTRLYISFSKQSSIIIWSIMNVYLVRVAVLKG